MVEVPFLDYFWTTPGSGLSEVSIQVFIEEHITEVLVSVLHTSGQKWSEVVKNLSKTSQKP